MVKLTRSQREILKILLKHGAMDTSRNTMPGAVHGNSVAALERKGLVKYVSKMVRGHRVPAFQVELTDEGREVAEAL